MAPKLRSDKGAAEAGKDTPRNTSKATTDDGSKVNFTPRPNRLPEPNDEAAEPVDPSDERVWQNVKPANDDEMQTWMKDMRALILAWLQHWRIRAEDVTVQQHKVVHEEAMKSEWQKWEPLTDVQTGEIYDSEQRNRMFEGMTAAYKASVNDYDINDADKARTQYRDAQGLWEGKSLLHIS